MHNILNLFCGVLICYFDETLLELLFTLLFTLLYCTTACTYCYILYLVLPSLVLLQYCTLFYCQRHTVTLVKWWIWWYLGFLWLTASIQVRLWRLHFYDHSDIKTKMVWSQIGHIKRRLLYRFFIWNVWGVIVLRVLFLLYLY